YPDVIVVPLEHPGQGQGVPPVVAHPAEEVETDIFPSEPFRDPSKKGPSGVFHEYITGEPMPQHCDIVRLADLWGRIYFHSAIKIVPCCGFHKKFGQGYVKVTKCSIFTPVKGLLPTKTIARQ